MDKAGPAKVHVLATLRDHDSARMVAGESNRNLHQRAVPDCRQVRFFPQCRPS